MLNDVLKEVDALVGDLPAHRSSVEALVELVPRIEELVTNLERIVGAGVSDVKAIASLDPTSQQAKAAATTAAAVQLAPAPGAAPATPPEPIQLTTPAAAPAPVEPPAGSVQLPEPPAPTA